MFFFGLRFWVKLFVRCVCLCLIDVDFVSLCFCGVAVLFFWGFLCLWACGLNVSACREGLARQVRLRKQTATN